MHARLIADWMTAAGTIILAGTGVWALIYASKELKDGREAEKIKHLIGFVQDFEREPMGLSENRC
jgi:hypothetical protein